MRNGSILLTAAALLLWHANDTLACSCGTPPSPKVSLQHSAAVFTGKVISVEPQSAWPKDAVAVTVEVDRIWKGPASTTIIVETAADGGACGYEFTIGEKYLLYCGRSWFSDWKSPGGLGTSICSRTKPLHAAGADLKELGAGRTVAEHRRIVSRMSTTDGVYTSRSSIPLALEYKGDLEGWKGHIDFDAETGTIEISGDMFLRVTDRLGRDVEPMSKSKIVRIEDQPIPTDAFSTLIDLTRVYDLDRRRLKTDGREGKAIFTVTWGCRGIAEQSSHIVVIPPIGQHTAPGPQGAWPLVPWKHPPPDSIVLNPAEPWRISRGWGPPFTDNVAIDTAAGYPKFIVLDANRLHTWIRYGLMIDTKQHPILVLKYRASNLAKKDQYGLWLDDGTGKRGNGLEVFKLSQLIADGEIHELRADLRTLKPAGNINGMAVGVFCSDKAPAVFELLGIRFDPPETALKTTDQAP